MYGDRMSDIRRGLPAPPRDFWPLVVKTTPLPPPKAAPSESGEFPVPVNPDA